MFLHEFIFNKKSYTGSFRENSLDLTPVKFLILLNLLEHSNKPISAESLFVSSCGGQFYKGVERTISVHIAHLRKKLNRADKHLGDAIKNIRNNDYVFSL
ncbi:winged helix-turn-helix domain-containing protein [Treponema phagedenis]|uniref:winged helix-turn-helix domain-containing protein n=1 Tax=Treponema phagedenis TaxID=162 RepID=UPI001655FBB4|nr:winged helix-turn-helix domain-containing protein [Treponema phagedenis]